MVTSIFSFSHNVFKSLLYQGCQKSSLCGKGLTVWPLTVHSNIACKRHLYTYKYIGSDMSCV